MTNEQAQALNASIAALLNAEACDQVGGPVAELLEQTTALVLEHYRWIHADPANPDCQEALESFLSPAFAQRAAMGYMGYGAAFDAAMAEKETDWVIEKSCSPRSRSVARGLRKAAKASLCPFSGVIEDVTISLGKDWYLHRHEGRVCLISEASEVMTFMHGDCLWVFPHERTVVWQTSGYGVDSIKSNVARLFARLLANADAVKASISCSVGSRPLALSDFWCPHIGHYLWNAVSAWHNALALAQGVSIARLWIYEGQAFFAPLPDIVAPLIPPGAATQGVHDEDAFFKESVESGELLFTVKDDYLRTELVERIIALCREQCDPAFVERARAFKAQHRPIILFTLRLGNRAWINQENGWPDFVRRILESYPNAAFVIDGMNSDTTKAWTTSWMSLEQEVDMAQSIVRQIGPETPVMTAVGGKLCESVHLCELIDCFVSPAGTGMIVYKWLTNKPGLSFSNTVVMNPAHGFGNLRVWDRYRDDIVAADYMPIEHITDVEVMHDDPSRTNFLLDGRVLAEVALGHMERWLAR